MVNHIIDVLPIDRLLLDLKNPRHDILKNQDEAIREMLDDQVDKLINLARDIVAEGINPSDLTIVIPDEFGSDKYIVVEGNRRVAAIKILLEPSLALLGQESSLKKQFDELGKQFSSRFNKLQCVIFQKREDATHWIQLKHTGENKGVGIVKWEGEAVARFNKSLGKPSIALQVVEFVKKHSTLDETTKNNIDDIPITNLSRLVHDPKVRDFLGMRLENGELCTDLPKVELLKGLTKIVRDVANKKINVNNIRSKENRQTYLEAFKRNEMPSQTASLESTWKLQSLPEEAGQIPIQLKKSLPLSISRKALIPSRCILKIAQTRINGIYREMKQLEVDDYPNAAAVMLRVFFELSLDEYIESKNVPLPERKQLENINLPEKAQIVAKYLEDHNILTQDQLKPLRVAISNPNNLLSINTLHAYVHNKNISPKPNDLKLTWDNMQLVIEKIWE